MDFNKCGRCGNFYVAEGMVCPKCSPKDGFEFNTFQSYVAKNGFEGSLDTISGQTGIAVKNLNRFLGYEGFEGTKKDIQNMKSNSILGNDGIFFNG